MTDKENNDKEKIENPIARLTEKVINSDFFLAIGTSTYLRELQYPYSSISMQVKMAKKYNKPTIILIDSKLPEVKKLELDRYLYDMNIMGTIEIDWKSGKSIDDAICQIDDILIKHGIK